MQLIFALTDLIWRIVIFWPNWFMHVWL